MERRTCLVVHAQHKSAGSTLITASRRYLADRQQHPGLFRRRLTAVDCDTGLYSTGWDSVTRRCSTGNLNLSTVDMLYNGWVMSMAEESAFSRSRCEWVTAFREPLARLVSGLFYCSQLAEKLANETAAGRKSALGRRDALCGARRLDPARATLRQWARHWGNYLLRELVRLPFALFPPSSL